VITRKSYAAKIAEDGVEYQTAHGNQKFKKIMTLVERPQLTTIALKKDLQVPDNILYHFFEIEGLMG
jgi:hypothetical protein